MAGAIHVIFGSDDGVVSEKALKLFEKLRPEGGDDFANDIIDGAASDSEDAYRICAEAIQALQTLPFFGGGKVVWLKGASFMGDDRTGGAERAKAGVEALLEELKAGVADDVTFILSAVVIDKRRAFYKWLNKEAQVDIYDKIDTSRPGWEEKVALLVKRQAKEKGLMFSQDALDYFVMQAGEDTRQIRSELDKLDLYLGEGRREIEEEDVITMVPLSRNGVIFEISRAVEKGDGQRSILLINQQLEQGVSPIAIMRASIVPTVRNLFMARVLMERLGGFPSSYDRLQAEIRKLPPRFVAALPQNKSGAVNAYPLFLAGRHAGKYTVENLQEALESCLEADRALVTTGLDSTMVLHRLVIQLTAMTVRKRSMRAAG